MERQTQKYQTAPPPKTWRHGRAVRLFGHDYAMDQPVHLTVCAKQGQTLITKEIAELITASVERTADLLSFDLYAYCLMPDHLHVLVSPGASETPVSKYLRRMKNFTTHECQRRLQIREIWQFSAHDRVLRKDENVFQVATYIANNPVRAGLVEKWSDWPFSKILVTP